MTVHFNDLHIHRLPLLSLTTYYLSFRLNLSEGPCGRTSKEWYWSSDQD
uniref:Uncharacterized protein n=1 Tax=Anguilla anguilla TaxID=7936 RepID=A0A0E9RI65_ANGAN